MRDVKAAAPRPTPARALDDVSDHLGQVLRHADELLDEWRRFGMTVRGQVERETAAIGEAVATAVDGAVARSVAETAAGVDRAVAQTMSDRVGAQLQNLAAELARLEGRAKAASRAITDQRAGDRRLLWAVIAGIAVANVLLLVLVLRKPQTIEAAPAAVPVVEPRHDEPAATPPEPPAGDGSAAPAPASAIEAPLPPVDSEVRGARGVPTRAGDAATKIESGAHADAHGAPRRH